MIESNDGDNNGRVPTCKAVNIYINILIQPKELVIIVITDYRAGLQVVYKNSISSAEKIFYSTCANRWMLRGVLYNII